VCNSHIRNTAAFTLAELFHMVIYRKDQTTELFQCAFTLRRTVSMVKHKVETDIFAHLEKCAFTNYKPHSAHFIKHSISSPFSIFTYLVHLLLIESMLLSKQTRIPMIIWKSCHPNPQSHSDM